MNVKVSIIVPVFKTKDTLVECVNSLLKQTLEQIEIILVDDGSPDESGIICDSFLCDERVKVIHKENGGLSSARNAGIKVATGEYIGFVDSDDYAHFDMYQDMYNTIKECDSDICICSHFTIDAEGNIHEHYFRGLPSLIEREGIINHLILPLIGANKGTNGTEFEGFVCRNLYRRELIFDYEFKSEREFFAEDVISDLELYIKCKRISILNKCKYYYRYNSESLSNRYRPNIYAKLNNLLQWEEEYLVNQRLTEQGLNRLYRTGVKFILFSAQNVKKGNLGQEDEIKEFKKILKQDMFDKSIKHCAFMTYNLKMKVFILLCRMRMVKLLRKIFR